MSGQWCGSWFLQFRKMSSPHNPADASFRCGSPDLAGMLRPPRQHLHHRPSSSDPPRVMANDPLAHDRNFAVAQKILHVDFGAEMGVGDTGPFDVALDELVPAMVRDLNVISTAGTEMDDIFHAGLPGVVYQCLALA